MSSSALSIWTNVAADRMNFSSGWTRRARPISPALTGTFGLPGGRAVIRSAPVTKDGSLTTFSGAAMTTTTGPLPGGSGLTGSGTATGGSGATGTAGGAGAAGGSTTTGGAATAGTGPSLSAGCTGAAGGTAAGGGTAKGTGTAPGPAGGGNG